MVRTRITPPSIPPVRRREDALAYLAKSLTRKSPVMIDKPDPQAACPLFHGRVYLPQEIRQIVFQLALQSYEDTTKPRQLDCSEWPSDKVERANGKYRPGHFHHRRIDTALLLTCRRIYDETYTLPVKVNRHTVWYDRVFGPNYHRATAAKIQFRKMTPEQLLCVQELHIYAERRRLYAQEPGAYARHTVFDELCSMRAPKRGGGLFPQRLTITIRHTDWYNGSHPAKYSLDCMLANRHWENTFGGLKVLKMELEAPAKRKEHLKSLSKNLREFTFEIGNGEVLIADSNVEGSVWNGKILVDDDSRQGALIYKKLVDQEIYVATVTWRVHRISEQ